MWPDKTGLNLIFLFFSYICYLVASWIHGCVRFWGIRYCGIQHKGLKSHNRWIRDMIRCDRSWVISGAWCRNHVWLDTKVIWTWIRLTSLHHFGIIVAGEVEVSALHWRDTWSWGGVDWRSDCTFVGVSELKHSWLRGWTLIDFWLYQLDRSDSLTVSCYMIASPSCHGQSNIVILQFVVRVLESLSRTFFMPPCVSPYNYWTGRS